jgi:hypothetical protein
MGAASASGEAGQIPDERARERREALLSRTNPFT